MKIRGPHLRRLGKALGFLTCAGAVAALAFIAVPLPRELLRYRPVASVRILDRNGGLLRELLSRDDGRAVWLPPEQLPAQVRNAFIAAEDKGFQHHLGVSPLAIGRALVQDVRAHRVVSGGSTITQQLARNLVPRPRTLAGKLQEALWALRLEAHLSKDEILAQYLNRIPFGNGVFGIEAASELYFGRSAEHLSVAQAAVLASIPRGPTAYNPLRKADRLRARQAWVLDRMVAAGLLASDRADQAKSEPWDLVAFSQAFRAPHFVSYVARNLDRWGLSDAVTIETTLDPALQAQVEEIIATEISRLSDRRVGSAAALVVDNVTGEVLAYQGSADFFNSQALGENDGVQMRRQPGSALKPFVYAEAFRDGLTPATVVADTEAHFGGTQGVYAPKNYDRRNHGPVRLREALANSYNVPAVRLAEQLGEKRVHQALWRAGFHSLTQSPEHYGLGLVLGDGEVSLWEAARAYSGMSRGGVLRPLIPIRRALRADGSEIPLRPELRGGRFADATSVALVTSILSDAASRARAFGLDNALRLPFPAAAKTGTSKGYSDNWTVGFTRERTVAVWAGNFDGTPMVQVSGITGAGPVWKRVMLRAMDGVRPEPLTSISLEHARVCPASGELAGPDCPTAMDEVFAPGTAPKSSCRMHRHLSSNLAPELAARCADLSGPRGVVTDLGTDFYDWAQAEGVAREPWLASACAGVGESDSGPPEVVFPLADEEFMLFSDLPPSDQQIPLRVRAPGQVQALEVRMDGQRLFDLLPPFRGHLPATRGAHFVTVHAKDTGALIAEVRFRVRTERGD